MEANGVTVGRAVRAEERRVSGCSHATSGIRGCGRIGYAADGAGSTSGIVGGLLTEGRILQAGHSAWRSDETFRRDLPTWCRDASRWC